MKHAAGAQPAFPPCVAVELIKLACEMPDKVDRSLSLWSCAELARTLQRDGVVEEISAQSVQRILLSQKLKPWRVQTWLSPKTPRDEVFREKTLNICRLYTCPLAAWEVVLCVDEKTSIQPRPRTAPTKPAQPGGAGVAVEAEYRRAGALNLLAAFNIRTGEVIGICRRRKRQVEFLALLEEIDRKTAVWVTLIHLVCDNVRMHSGKLVYAWLSNHPRFRMHFTPVHCSWMNQVEQWFSIVQRKRLTVSNFTDLQALEEKLLAFIEEWNQQAHPFRWTSQSFEKVLAKIGQLAA
jgi:DDE superfamily endonuclease